MKTWTVVVGLVLFFCLSCKQMGCFSLEDACYECCKQKLDKKKGRMGGKAAFLAREPCTEQCMDSADSLGKDAYWVEKKGAC